MSRRRFGVPRKILGLWAGEGGESGEGGYGGDHGQADAGAGSRGGGGDGGSRSVGSRGYSGVTGGSRSGAMGSRSAGSRGSRSRSASAPPSRSTTPADSPGGLGTILGQASRATGGRTTTSGATYTDPGAARLAEIRAATARQQAINEANRAALNERIAAQQAAQEEGAGPPETETQPQTRTERETRPSDTTGGGGGGYTAAQNILSSYVRQQADRAWQAEERRLRELGRVDDLFRDRDAFYAKIGQSILDQGKAKLGEWLRNRARQDRFSLAARNLIGGSADIEAENRRTRERDDALTNVQSAARSRQQAAKAHDSALKSSLKQGVLQGSRFTGADAAAARPRLAQKTSYDQLDANSFNQLFSSLGDALMAGRTGVQQPTGRIR